MMKSDDNLEFFFFENVHFFYANLLVKPSPLESDDASVLDKEFCKFLKQWNSN